jgi:hypothetical protein
MDGDRKLVQTLLERLSARVHAQVITEFRGREFGERAGANYRAATHSSQTEPEMITISDATKWSRCRALP